MTKDEIMDFCAEFSEDILLADGYEAAFIGVALQFTDPVACYNRNACISILMERDGMSFQGAVEFFESNTQGAYVGKHTPIFLVTNEEGGVDRTHRILRYEHMLKICKLTKELQDLREHGGYCPEQKKERLEDLVFAISKLEGLGVKL